MRPLLLGFDIGGTKMAVVLGTVTGEIISREEFPSTSPSQTKRSFIEIGKSLLTGCADGALAACGISAPGPMSSRRGMILTPPNMPAWRDEPVKQWIADAFGVPTGMENDANAAAVAEWLWGYNKAVDNLIYLTCGTGMGAGLVLDGRLYRGKEDLAGEVGHLRILPFGPVGFFKAGSLEGLTRGGALADLARLRIQEPHATSVLDGVTLEGITPKAGGDAALAGDPFAQTVVQESASYLGQGCALLIDILNPERISLGSLARRLGAFYINTVRESAKKEAIPAAFEHCVIDAAALGDRVQDLAAMAVALDTFERARR